MNTSWRSEKHTNRRCRGAEVVVAVACEAQNAAGGSKQFRGGGALRAMALHPAIITLAPPRSVNFMNGSSKSDSCTRERCGRGSSGSENSSSTSINSSSSSIIKSEAVDPRIGRVFGKLNK